MKKLSVKCDVILYLCDTYYVGLNQFVLYEDNKIS